MIDRNLENGDEVINREAEIIVKMSKALHDKDGW